MKGCELCQLPARTYCESDQAILCWDCDAKVHGANFLVARHCRSLLCHACQAPTPWKASGPKLGHTFSVCESCVVRDGNRGGEDDEESQGGNDNEFDTDNEDDDSDGDDDDDDDVDVDEEDGDVQVVPWSSSTLPPPSASSSSSEEASSMSNNGDRDGSETVSTVSLKRFRENASDLRSQDDLERSSPQRRYGSSALTAPAGRSGTDGSSATSVDSLRPSKHLKIDLNGPGLPSAPVTSLRRYRRQDSRKLSEGSEAVNHDHASKPS